MPSKSFEYATAFYNALNDAATTDSVNDKVVRVFRGSIVKTYRGLGVSFTYYSEVRQGLINSGSISILHQGTRGNESIIVIHREPDEESFEAAKDMSVQPLTRPSSDDILIQQLEDLKRLIGGIDITEALIFFEQRFTELDQRITIIEQQTQEKGE